MDDYKHDMIQMNLRYSDMLQWEQYLKKLEEKKFNYNWLRKEAGIHDDNIIKALYNFHKDLKELKKERTIKKRTFDETAIALVDEFWDTIWIIFQRRKR